MLHTATPIQAMTIIGVCAILIPDDAKNEESTPTFMDFDLCIAHTHMERTTVRRFSICEKPKKPP
jgi:hypothetical protein